MLTAFPYNNYAMNKKARYTINGALIGGVLLGGINAIDQFTNPAKKPFDWRKMGESLLTGGVIGGIAGLIFGAIADWQNSQENPVDTDSGLLALAQAAVRLLSLSVMLDYQFFS